VWGYLFAEVPIGIVFAKVHHVSLPFKKAFLTVMYFSLPIICLKIIPTIMEQDLSGVPENEVSVLFLGIALIGVFMIGLPMLFNAWILSFVSKSVLNQHPMNG
jgi:hypothetical protein